MSMLKMPPGRTSISQFETAPQDFGMYHFLRCSGFVNASQTRCLGASMDRSRTKSLFGLIAKGLLMISIPFLELFDVFVEPIKSGFPQLTLLGQPVLSEFEPCGRDLISPHPASLLRRPSHSHTVAFNIISARSRNVI